MTSKNKKKTKKKITAVIISLAVLIPAITLLFVIMNFHPGKISAANINSIKVTSAQGEEFIYTDEETFRLYSKIFSDASEIENPAHELSSYKIFHLFVDGKSDDINCDLLLTDLAEDCLLRMAGRDKTVYKNILPEYAQVLLADKNFDTAYTYYLPPKAQITASEQTKDILPSEMEWNFRKIDNKFYPSDVTSFISDEILLFDYTPDKCISITFELVPDAVSVQIFDGENSVFSGKYDSEEYKSFTYNKKTRLKYVFTAEWYETSSARYHGKAVYKADANYIIAPVGLISSSKITQGEFSVMSIYNTADNEKLTFENEDFEFFRHNDARLILYPSYIGGFTGQKELNVIDSDGNRVSDFIEITAPEKTPASYTASQADVQKYVMDYENQNTALASVRVNTLQNENKLWDGEFASPLDSAETVLNYGGTVVCEGEEAGKSSFMLLKSDLTDVKCIGVGKVAFAGVIEPFGKTMIINHGFGIYSFYANLDSFYLSQGDSTTKGITVARLSEDNKILQYGVMVSGYFTDPEKLNSCLELAGLM